VPPEAGPVLVLHAPQLPAQPIEMEHQD
jgi:hypothetical protein